MKPRVSRAAELNALKKEREDVLRDISAVAHGMPPELQHDFNARLRTLVKMIRTARDRAAKRS